MMSWKLTKSKLELSGPFDDDYLLSLKVATRGHMGLSPLSAFLLERCSTIPSFRIYYCNCSYHYVYLSIFPPYTSK